MAQKIQAFYCERKIHNCRNLGKLKVTNLRLILHAIRCVHTDGEMAGQLILLSILGKYKDALSCLLL